MRRPFALAGAIVSVLLVACTSTPPLPQRSLLPGEPTPRGTGQPVGVVELVPACDVIRKGDVATALGIEIEQAHEGRASADERGWMSECLFSKRFEDIPLVLTVASGEPYQSRFNEIATEPVVSLLDGVGDEALLLVNDVWGLDHPISSLFVRDGGALIGLALGISDMTEAGAPVVPGGPDDQQRMLVELANVALGRLAGPDPNASPPPVSSRTCALLSVAEADRETGYGLASAEDVDEQDVWGPSCRYSNAGGDVKLFVSVSDQPAANAQFESCQQEGEIVIGVGEEATVGGGCYPFIEGAPISEMLLARSGQTVVAVGHSSLEMNSRNLLVAVARLLLTKLGKDPGITPRPVLPSLLTHPCALIDAAQVGPIVGRPITDVVARPDDFDRQQSECEYRAGDDADLVPLYLRIDAGSSVLDTWRGYLTYNNSGKTPVEGIGDGALYTADDTYGADHPIVTMWVLSGNVMLAMSLGPVGTDANFKYVAPGTIEEQLAMLRQLAEIILPRLYAQ